MPQCKEPHPNTPNTHIFLCVLEKGHKEDHVTYALRNVDYFWPVETPAK